MQLKRRVARPLKNALRNSIETTRRRAIQFKLSQLKRRAPFKESQEFNWNGASTRYSACIKHFWNGASTRYSKKRFEEFNWNGASTGCSNKDEGIKLKRCVDALFRSLQEFSRTKRHIDALFKAAWRTSVETALQGGFRKTFRSSLETARRIEEFTWTTARPRNSTETARRCAIQRIIK